MLLAVISCHCIAPQLSAKDMHSLNVGEVFIQLGDFADHLQHQLNSLVVAPLSQYKEAIEAAVQQVWRSVVRCGTEWNVVVTTVNRRAASHGTGEDVRRGVRGARQCAAKVSVSLARLARRNSGVRQPGSR